MGSNHQFVELNGYCLYIHVLSYILNTTFAFLPTERIACTYLTPLAFLNNYSSSVECEWNCYFRTDDIHVATDVAAISISTLEGQFRVARYHLRRRCDSAATSLRQRCDVAPTSLRRRCDVAPTSLRRRSDIAATSLRQTRDRNP